MTLWVPGSSPGHAFTGAMLNWIEQQNVSPPIVAAGFELGGRMLANADGSTWHALTSASRFEPCD